MSTDRQKHFTETRTGPGPCPVSGPAGQILSTIDSDALLTAASPDEEEGEGLRERKMKMKNSSSCVLLERHRRKRITQSCSTLRQLLPMIPRGRVDMVTVLDTTVAFLEKVQELVPAEDQCIQLCPPAELHADWLRRSQENREVGHKMAAEQEKKLNRTSRRHTDGQLPVS
ncbi:spermatogenesis- and oogenesis-specific basic helix-loop-helix-containing protein 1-like [Epinephelus fuscoguttatus]|uniref:spermatogenesis- and oogenesis-specific basic helix-loop-helix-containing protein 1-like n=1 Tax=Epinephelus fuscoguttatus TaxID=293821 RepID=UPI0020D0F424|nr:spermatogenesis- and oogenesis-specific basic helix-loop-helix-containing protein 1-like [Epinephelus fuscoguttatus]